MIGRVIRIGNFEEREPINNVWNQVYVDLVDELLVIHLIKIKFLTFEFLYCNNHKFFKKWGTSTMSSAWWILS